MRMVALDLLVVVLVTATLLRRLQEVNELTERIDKYIIGGLNPDVVVEVPAGENSSPATAEEDKIVPPKNTPTAEEDKIVPPENTTTAEEDKDAPPSATGPDQVDKNKSLRKKMMNNGKYVTTLVFFYSNLLFF
ncbi:hypothetical protein OROMI_027010 [Orobanche minor]